MSEESGTTATGDTGTTEGGQQAATEQAAAEAWKAPQTQADLDRIVEQRLSRERAKYGMTPEQARQFKERTEAAESESATEVEKREKAARKAAQDEAQATYRPKLAETAFRVAIGTAVPAAEVDEFIADLNLSRFVTEAGDVDTTKVLARVAQFTQSATQHNQQTTAPRGPLIPGHTVGAGPVSKPGDGARAALAARGIKID